MSRLRKFKTNKRLIVLIKICVVFYVSIAMIGYLVSGTGAYFNDVNSEKQVIQAGTWWDGSELKFVKNNTENIKSCPPATITVEIKNVGNSMMAPAKYEIYYGETGEPKSNGIKIAEGQIKALNAGDTIKLSYEAKRIGSYMFKALQTPGYNNNYEERHAEWSNKLMVKCIEDDTQKQEKKTENEDTTRKKEPSKANEEKEAPKSENPKPENVTDQKNSSTENETKAGNNIEKEPKDSEENVKEDIKEDQPKNTEENSKNNDTKEDAGNPNASPEEKSVIGDDEDETLKKDK